MTAHEAGPGALPGVHANVDELRHAPTHSMSAVLRIRGMRAYAELSPPGTSNGERPTSSCHRVAASE